MTYRLSIPTPARGVSSHITTAAAFHYGDWTLTSLLFIRLTVIMRLATGTNCTINDSCFAYLSESWSNSNGLQEMRFWVIAHYIFFVLQYLISLHVFDDDAVTSVTVSLANH